MHDFKFVKRDVVKKGHQWDFVHVKHLCGICRLCVRLLTSGENIEQKDATLATGSDNVVSSPSHASTSFVRLCNSVTSASGSVVPVGACDEIVDEELPEFYNLWTFSSSCYMWNGYILGYNKQWSSSYSLYFIVYAFTNSCQFGVFNGVDAMEVVYY